MQQYRNKDNWLLDILTASVEGNWASSSWRRFTSHARGLFGLELSQRSSRGPVASTKALKTTADWEPSDALECICAFTCCITVSAYTGLLGVFILDALKSVFFRAPLAHFEKTGAPVWCQRQLLQHDVLRHVAFPPKIHLYIWTRQTVNKQGGDINWFTSRHIYFLSSHLSSSWIADSPFLPVVVCG